MSWFVRIKFEPRDAWVGLFFDTAKGWTYICLVPFFPIIVGRKR
jgi:hypothetical protein